jgi:hypothetical protein
MSNTVKPFGARASSRQTWKAKEQKAIGHLVAVCGRVDDVSDTEDAVNAALDVLTVAHMAARFELDRGPPSNWEDRETRMIERLFVVFEKFSGSDEDPEARKP